MVGGSPGALFVDMTVSADTCETARTVAAHIHGPPIKDPRQFMAQSKTMSQWTPVPLKLGAHIVRSIIRSLKKKYYISIFKPTLIGIL